MLSIYIGVASFSVIVVCCFVDSLPEHFLDSDTNVTDSTKSEVSVSYSGNILSCDCLLYTSDAADE